jgi:hypothetical protein
LTDKPDPIARLLADARASAAECDAQTDALGEFKDSLRPLQLRPAPERPKTEPELTGNALAFEQMRRLATLMRGRSDAAYNRAAKECLETLVVEAKELARHSDDVLYELGVRLYFIKRFKPRGVKWGTYLKEIGMPLGKSRANESIRVFLGMTTALKLKEKNTAKNRRWRAKAAVSDGRPTVENIEDFNVYIRQIIDFWSGLAKRLEARAELGFTDEEKQALQLTLHQAANELTLMAQRLDD